MKESEFLERINDAAVNMAREINGLGAERTNFNWNEQSVVFATGAQLITEKTSRDLVGLISLVVRKLARQGCAFTLMDFELYRNLRNAWERFNEEQQKERT